MTEPLDPRDILLDLLKEPTDRDRQTKIGASNFSQPCARCLAEAMLSTAASDMYDRPYWAGAVIGTAIHRLLDARVQERYPDWESEQHVIVGEIPDYGVVKSTTDLYIPDHFQVVDWKTTTKVKLPHIKEALKTVATDYDTSVMQETRYKVTGYRYQVQAYGLALTRMGFRVEWVSLGFICRDAVGDNDIWGWTEAYDPEVAEKVWKRVNDLWAWLQEGNDSATLPSARGCYTCSHYR